MDPIVSNDHYIFMSLTLNLMIIVLFKGYTVLDPSYILGLMDYNLNQIQ